ncbi:MAG: hypothetical protein IT337_13180 [Thermomicrobiales bacterium]|nr:hypothetical protein [Thermomicrobiales bacterium]
MAKRWAAWALGALLLIGGAAPGAVLAANKTETYKAQDHTVYAQFEERDGNLRTITTVIATKNATSTPDRKQSPLVMVSSVTYDTKKGKMRWNAFGTTTRPDAFNIDSKLGGGAVKAKVRVYDAVKEQTFTVNVDVKWNADGKVHKGQTDSFTVNPPKGATDGVKLAVKAVGDIRDATTSGTVKKGGAVWGDGNAKDAELYDLDSLLVTVTRPEQK